MKTQPTTRGTAPACPIQNAIFTAIAALFLLATPVFGQQIDTLDIAQFNLTLVSPAGTLQEGETATFELHVGTASASVDDAVGFDIDLTLHTNAVLPTSCAADITESWMLDASSTLETSTDSLQHSIRVQADRSGQGGISGYGELFRFTLTAAEDGTDPATMVSGGGLIMTVDNLGFKRRPEEVAPAFSFYPNPCQGRLTLSADATQADALLLTDATGHVHQLPLHAVRAGQLDLSAFGPGWYYLTLRTGEQVQTKALRILR